MAFWETGNPVRKTAVVVVIVMNGVRRRHRRDHRLRRSGVGPPYMYRLRNGNTHWRQKPRAAKPIPRRKCIKDTIHPTGRKPFPGLYNSRSRGSRLTPFVTKPYARRGTRRPSRETKQSEETVYRRRPRHRARDATTTTTLRSDKRVRRPRVSRWRNDVANTTAPHRCAWYTVRPDVTRLSTLERFPSDTIQHARASDDGRDR